jgi:hypothetical protein
MGHHSAGYPIITHFTKKTMSKQGGFNFGGTNASGQVSSMSKGIFEILLTQCSGSKHG